MSARFAPTVHGDRDHGFISYIVAAARDKGVSAYVGDGANRWSAVHRSDAARLVRLGLEQAPAGSILHAVAEQGLSTKAIAEAIGRGLDLPVKSVAPENAVDHFGFIGSFFAMDLAASSERTQELLRWEATRRDPRRGHRRGRVLPLIAERVVFRYPSAWSASAAFAAPP